MLPTMLKGDIVGIIVIDGKGIIGETRYAGARARVGWAKEKQRNNKVAMIVMLDWRDETYGDERRCGWE